MSKIKTDQTPTSWLPFPGDCPMDTMMLFKKTTGEWMPGKYSNLSFGPVVSGWSSFSKATEFSHYMIIP
jgi:hypothetical protein